MVGEWTTLEILEFMNSYNRLYKVNPEEATMYTWLYEQAFDELMMNRSTLMALLY